MNDLAVLSLAGCAGIALGAAFFAGLWWTVCRAVRTRRPALWFVLSFVLRTSVAVAGFYAVGRGDWKRMAACLAGFAVARWVMTVRFREAAHHAP